MTKALLRDTLRAIRKTFSRFISIVIIVALGVGFYAGLKAVSPNMKGTADAFYHQLHMADIVLTSTVGFDLEDVRRVQEESGVSYVTPSRYIDGLLYKDGVLEQSMSGTAYVLRIIGYDFNTLEGSGSDRLNQLTLVDGRRPYAPNECVVSVYESRNDPLHYTIGSVLTLQGDHEDLLDAVKFTEYTIVGTVYTPEFVSMELGASQAGGGELSGYIYVPDDDFQWDYYTTLYVGVTGAGESEAYTPEYEAKVRQVQERLDQISLPIVQARAERLRETIGPQLEEGKAELEVKRKEAEEKLAQAREDLRKLKDGVANGTPEYERQKAEAEKKIEAAKKELEQGRIDYDKNWKEYEANLAKYNEGLAEAEKHPNAQAEYDEAKNKLDIAESNLDAAKYMIVGARSALKVANNALTSENEERIKNAMDILSAYVPIGEDHSLEGLRAQVAEGEAKLAEQEAAYEEGKKEMDAKKAELAKVEPLIKQLEELGKAGEQLQKARDQLMAAKQKIDNGPAEIEAAEARLAEELQKAQKDMAYYQDLASHADEDYAKAEADAKQQIADAERTIRRGENLLLSLPNAQWLLSDRDEFAGYTNYGQTADNMKSFALVFPVLFFLIAALVSLTTMTRMVEDERMQLGVLKAAGYSAGAIAFKYLFYAFTAGFLGSVLGMALGFTLIPIAIFQAYSILYLIPSMTPAFYLGTAATGLGAAILSTVGAVVFSVLRSLRLRPAQLLRPKAPKAGKRVFLERIPPLWAGLSFSNKVTVRNLLRNKKRFFMTFAGIMGCTALLLTGFGIGNSIGTMLGKQFGADSIMMFDGQALLTAPIQRGNTDAMKVFDQPGRIAASLPVYMKNMYAETEAFGRQLKITLAVPANAQTVQDFVQLKDPKSGQALKFDSRGIFIGAKTAELMNLSVGDEITIQAGSVRAKIPVAGITQNYVYHYAYLAPEAYEHFFGVEATQFNAVLIKLTPELAVYDGARDAVNAAKEARTQLSRDLTDEAEVIAVVYNASIIDKVGSMIDIMSSVIVSVFTIAAGALAFVVLYNLNNINIYERIRELATIKVLGFYDLEASMYIYRENLIITILGIVCGLALGIPIHGFVIRTAEIESMMFVRTLAPMNYVWSALITVVFAVGINALMHKKIKDISMVESLKSVE
ncbi:MAG: hypothetical protein LBJ11_09850 [Oscillospiraceae bacterium]|nr:hypothetical protein [Oscillospiraceae bacterium]